jgi:hypothetical protein
MSDCSFCPGKIVWKNEDFVYPDVDWLVLKGHGFGKCDACGEVYVDITAPLLLEEWITREIVLNRQIGPKEIRFLRIVMGARNAWAFATMIGTQERVIKSWEGGVKPGTHIIQRVREHVQHNRPKLFEVDHPKDEGDVGKVYIQYSGEPGQYIRVAQPS